MPRSRRVRIPTPACASHSQPHSRTAAAAPPRCMLSAPLRAPQDGVEGKARVLGLLLSYVVLLKALFPLRLGSTLLLTPQMQRLLSGGGSILGGLGLGGRSQPLKSELLSLAAASRGGLVPLGAEEQARFDEIVAELRELNADERSASDPRLTGAWECQWTSEKEVSFAPSRGASPKSVPDLKLTLFLSVGLILTLTLTLTLILDLTLAQTLDQINFAVEKGLFGEPWRRTVQSIDVAAGTLENRIEFEDGTHAASSSGPAPAPPGRGPPHTAPAEGSPTALTRDASLHAGLLRVCSTFAPDEDDGRRFNFAFESCDLRWRSVTLPLPPVGKGWGEVVYLDDDFRIQRDVRGDLLVATRLKE